jgi:hypothetical protein
MIVQIDANILTLERSCNQLFLAHGANAIFTGPIKHFNASPRDYKCLFTSGATSALKLVGKFFPWSRGSYYMYTKENHNSVLGIREYPTMKNMLSTDYNSIFWLVNTMYCIVILVYPLYSYPFYSDSVSFLVSSLN